LQVEEPVACWDGASFYFHATAASMLSALLVSTLPTFRGALDVRLYLALQKRFVSPGPYSGMIGWYRLSVWRIGSWNNRCWKW
jgi:hypothetical protein